MDLVHQELKNKNKMSLRKLGERRGVYVYKVIFGCVQNLLPFLLIYIFTTKMNSFFLLLGAAMLGKKEFNN